MVVERSKNILKISPIFYTSKLAVLFGGVKIFFKDFKTEFHSKNIRTLCALSKIFPPVIHSFLKWPIHLWPFCPKTYSECLSRFIKLNYSLWVLYPAFCFSWNLCKFNSSNIVLMDLRFCLIIMLKKAFLLRPLKLYEFSTGSVCINSRPTKRPTDLAIVLHINLNTFEMCKTWISSWQCLVGLELMRVEISLSFYSFSARWRWQYSAYWICL